MKGLVLSLVLVLAYIGNSMGQCSMCRIQLENNVSSGDTSFAAGLNFGILYLFAAPYLMVMVIAFLWYRNTRDNQGSLPDFNRNRY